MAYTKDLRTVCQAPGCVKWATLEVFNRWNASCGRFCKQDAYRMLTKLHTQEKEKPDVVTN